MKAPTHTRHQQKNLLSSYDSLNRAGWLKAAARVVAAFGLAGSAWAASQTWTNAPADSNWANTNNWVGLAVPGSLNLSGNTVNNDTATFNTPIPGSAIGGASAPVVPDDATINGDRSRQIGSIVFDTNNCGAYVFWSPSPPVLPTTTNPETGILNVSHNGSIRLNAPVANNQTFLVPLHVRLPSSTAGIYNLVNNSTNGATLYIASITNQSANTRGTVFVLDGTNTGTNTIASVSAGTTTSGANGLTKQGTGTWILSGPNDLRATTVIQVIGGTLIVKDPAAFLGAGSGSGSSLPVVSNATLRIDGVTLSQPSFRLRNQGKIQMNGSGTVNGVTVDTASGVSATLATTSASDVLSLGVAANTLTGGAADTLLHVSGPGTVLLSQGANYVGSWSVDAGTLQLAPGTFGALGTGANLNIGAGATYDISPLGAGAYNPETAGIGGSGTGSIVGTTAATLKADPGATIDLATGSKAINLNYTPTSSTGDATHPALYISQGTLSMGGNTITINNASGTPLNLGNYTIIQQASGSITDGGGYGAIVTGSGLAAGTAPIVLVSGGSVILHVISSTPNNLVWTGDGMNNFWDTGVSADWLNGSSPSTFSYYDNVTFNAIGLTNPFVSLSGTLLPTSVTVDTAGSTYTFTGSGKINGTATLTKTGTGTLLLQTVNTYDRGTLINNGAIQVGVQNALPAGGNVTVTSPGVLDLNANNQTVGTLSGNGTVDTLSGGAPVLTVGTSSNATFAGVIQNSNGGQLGLTKVGTGTLTLAAPNFYSGPTTLSAGKVVVSDAHALGIGDLVLSGGTLDVPVSQLPLDSLAGSGGAIVNDTTATTNRLVITGTTSTTFSGSIGDGAGGGGMALTLLGGTLEMRANNTYSGGTIVASGATFNIYNSPAGVTGALIASNNAAVGLTGGSGTPGTPTSITTVDGAFVTLTSGAEGKLFAGQFIGSATATNHFNTTGSGTGVSASGALSFQNFLGWVEIAMGVGHNFRFLQDGGTSGGNSTAFVLQSGNVHVRGSTTAGQTVYLGALFGGDSTSGIGGAATAGAQPTTWNIGGRNMDMVFGGYITDSNNLVKSGTGTLTLNGLNTVTNTDSATYTNYLYSPVISYAGTTTVSNGVLVLVTPNNLSNSPSITLAGPSAVLDATRMGYVLDQIDPNTSTATNQVLVTNGVFELFPGQTLAGVGTLAGTLQADNGSTVAPGVSSPGTLTVTGAVALNGLVAMELNRANTPANSDKVVANSFSITGNLVVTNVGPDLQDGDTFTLFSKPVSGFATVTLPAATSGGSTYVWTNMLAINGSIQLVSGGVPPVNTTPTNIVTAVSGSTLTLSWPADHTGWRLLVQTNHLTGVSTNPLDWGTVTGSSTTNREDLAIDPSKPVEFYRLVYP